MEKGLKLHKEYTLTHNLEFIIGKVVPNDVNIVSHFDYFQEKMSMEESIYKGKVKTGLILFLIEEDFEFYMRMGR